MVDEKKAKQEDVTVFPASEQVSIASMSPADFASRFKEFSRLLVRERDHVVLAGSRSGNSDAMVEMLRKDPLNAHVEERGLISWSGPKALDAISKATQIGNASTPASGQRSR